MSQSWVAPAATLIGVGLGAFLSYVFTRRAQHSKALHDSRTAAFAKLAAATMEYRRALMDRWFAQHGGTSSADSPDVYETRSAAWAALFEVQLLARDVAVSELARTAVDETSDIKNAKSREELVARAGESRTRVEAFVSAARAELAIRG